jgi:hypothetical protein
MPLWGLIAADVMAVIGDSWLSRKALKGSLAGAPRTADLPLRRPRLGDVGQRSEAA